MQHMLWAQARYLEMLSNRTTFALATNAPVVVPGQLTLAQYQQQAEGGAPTFVSELLNYFHCTRFNCPFTFAIVFQNPLLDFPIGGGRTLNQGWNAGPGMCMLSSWSLDNSPNFQSTLQHELGHSFGLPHVNVYGYSMSANMSIMSYNPTHHTSAFTPSPTPGLLIPEDLRILVNNKRVFPDLNFDASIDTPSGYSISPNYVWLGAQTIPGQTNYAIQAVTITGGDAYGTSPNCLFLKRIKPSAGPGVTFDSGAMWHSGTLADGWASIDVTLPLTVRLNKVVIHSQHSGLYHIASRLRLQKKVGTDYIDVCNSALQQADQAVVFSEAAAQTWRFHFYGADGMVTLRGIELFSGFDEIFPPAVPTFNNPPTIVTNPVSQLMHFRPSVTLIGHAVGSLPIRYQWQVNGTNMASCTDSLLCLSNISTANIGIYRLVASNCVTCVTSSPVHVGMLSYTVPPAEGPRFTLDAPTSACYRVEYASSVTSRDWNLWTNVCCVSGHAVMVDTAATNSSSRFYRLTAQ